MEKQNWLKEQEAGVKEQVDKEVTSLGQLKKGAGSKFLLVTLLINLFIFPSPGWPGTCHVKQPDLALTAISLPVFAS